jgi:hypothetical protein
MEISPQIMTARHERGENGMTMESRATPRDVPSWNSGEQPKLCPKSGGVPDRKGSADSSGHPAVREPDPSQGRIL